MKIIISSSEYVNLNGVPVVEISDGETTLTAADYDKLKLVPRAKRTTDRFLAHGVLQIKTFLLPSGKTVRLAVGTKKEPAGALTP